MARIRAGIAHLTNGLSKTSDTCDLLNQTGVSDVESLVRMKLGSPSRGKWLSVGRNQSL